MNRGLLYVVGAAPFLSLLFLVVGCGPRTQGGQGSVAFAGPAGLFADTVPWDALESGGDAVLDWNHSSAPDDSDGTTLIRMLGGDYTMRASGDFDDNDGSGWGVTVTLAPYNGAGAYQEEEVTVTFGWDGPLQFGNEFPSGDYQPTIETEAISGCSATIEIDTLRGRVDCSSVALTRDEVSVPEDYGVVVTWESNTTPWM